MATLHTLESLSAELRAWVLGSFAKPDQVEIKQLSGGANNLVFCVADKSSRVVVKTYPQANETSQDRFRAEFEVLSFANNAAPAFVPRLISSHPEGRFLVMEYLEGKRFESNDEIKTEQVEHAVAFIKRLNADRAAMAKAISVSAADGFYSLSEHAENVADRIAELTTNHLPDECRAEASILIEEVKRSWERIHERLQAALRGGLVRDELEMGQGCLSPSDFGFHNAIRTSSGIKFFDFEFAGWDDPTKMVLDFFLQPRIRVPTIYEPLFQQAVSGFMPLETLRLRAASLRPVLQLKWITIVLAVLRPQRLEALLRVAVATDAGVLINERLTTARRLLSQGVSDGLH